MAVSVFSVCITTGNDGSDRMEVEVVLSDGRILTGNVNKHFRQNTFDTLAVDTDDGKYFLPFCSIVSIKVIK